MAHHSGIRRVLIIAVVGLLTTSLSAFGQMGGGGGGGPAGGGGGGGGNGGGGGGSGSSLGGSGASNNNSNLGTGAVNLSSGNTGSSVNGSGPSSSGFLSAYYRYPGVTGMAATNSATSGTSTTQTVTSSVNDTYATYGSSSLPTTNGAGGRGGSGGGGRATIGGRGAGSGTAPNVYAWNALTSGDQLARMPHYTASIEFAPRPISSSVLRDDLQELISRSTHIPSKNQITIEVNGRNVTLKGEVADERESRAVAGQIRMTPGVGVIDNQLTYKQ